MTYRVEFTTRAAREFRQLPEATRRRIAVRIDALTVNPRPQGARKLTGTDDLYRLRTGDYRILYQIEDRVVLVTVIRIGHRRDVYR